MNLWIVVATVGKIITAGPMPYDMTECKARVVLIEQNLSLAKIQAKTRCTYSTEVPQS
ncbi:hypothetical protein [Rhizobium arsenicireducens]